MVKPVALPPLSAPALVTVASVTQWTDAIFARYRQEFRCPKCGVLNALYADVGLGRKRPKQARARYRRYKHVTCRGGSVFSLSTADFIVRVLDPWVRHIISEDLLARPSSSIKAASVVARGCARALRTLARAGFVANPRFEERLTVASPMENQFASAISAGLLSSQEALNRLPALCRSRDRKGALRPLEEDASGSSSRVAQKHTNECQEWPPLVEVVIEESPLSLHGKRSERRRCSPPPLPVAAQEAQPEQVGFAAQSQKETAAGARGGNDAECQNSLYSQDRVAQTACAVTSAGPKSAQRRQREQLFDALHNMRAYSGSNRRPALRLSYLNVCGLSELKWDSIFEAFTLAASARRPDTEHILILAETWRPVKLTHHILSTCTPWVLATSAPECASLSTKGCVRSTAGMMLLCHPSMSERLAILSVTPYSMTFTIGRSHLAETEQPPLSVHAVYLPPSMKCTQDCPLFEIFLTPPQSVDVDVLMGDFNVWYKAENRSCKQRKQLRKGGEEDRKGGGEDRSVVGYPVERSLILEKVSRSLRLSRIKCGEGIERQECSKADAQQNDIRARQMDTTAIIKSKPMASRYDHVLVRSTCRWQTNDEKVSFWAPGVSTDHPLMRVDLAAF